MAQKRRHPFFLWLLLETGSGQGSGDLGPNSPRSRPACRMDRSRKNSWSTRTSKPASDRRAPAKRHERSKYISFQFLVSSFSRRDKKTYNIRRKRTQAHFYKKIIVLYEIYARGGITLFESFNHTFVVCYLGE